MRAAKFDDHSSINYLATYVFIWIAHIAFKKQILISKHFLLERIVINSLLSLKIVIFYASLLNFTIIRALIISRPSVQLSLYMI